MKTKRLISIWMAILILCNSCSVVLAENIEVNEAQQEEVTNSQSTQDLSEQREEILDKIQESSVQLEIVQEELTTALNEIATLQQSIDSYENEVKAYREQLNTLQEKISQAEIELEQAEMKCQEQEDLLTERLVTNYEAGETRYLDFLLTSKGLIEFISNYYLVLQMAEWDNQLLDELEQQRNAIQEQKNQLDQDKADLKLLKAKAEQNETLLINTQALQEIKKDSLSEEERVIQEQIDQYRQEQYLIEEQIQLAIQNSQIDIQFTGGKMIWPVGKTGTYITSYFGTREHPILGVVKKHTGLDIGNAGYGAPVLAAADGVVSYAGVMNGYGNCVMINHGDGITTLYGHGQKILTQLGATVKQGDLIMEVGSTGLSTGPHLHFEVRVNGTAVNPLTYLQVGETNAE